MKNSTLTIRVVAWGKKGIERQVRTAVASSGGYVAQRRIIRELRGMSELEFLVTSTDPRLFGEVIEAVDRIDGVMIVGTEPVSDESEARTGTDGSR